MPNESDLKKETLRRSVLQLGVQKEVCSVLFAAFPEDSFSKYFEVFSKAVKQPSSLQNFTNEIQMQFKLGATGHVMIVVREFLSLQNFAVFTRDYIRRCCDMVEYFTKSRVAMRLHLEIKNKPLGSVVNMLQTRGYSHRFPKGLLSTLALFNKKIYCPAKHETVTKEEEHMYGVPDAVAVTFIAVQLCQQLEEFRKKFF